MLLKKLTETDQAYAFDFNDSYPYTQMLRDQIAGKNNSWAVRWYASAFLNDKYTLYPGRSLIYHAGGDGTGTNTGFDRHLDVELSNSPVKVTRINIDQNIPAYNALAKFYKRVRNPSILYRLKRKVRTFFASSFSK